MSSSNGPVPNRESQVKFAQNRVAAVEKYYGVFCDTLGSFIRKSARLRDKGDVFSTHVKEYADAEQLNNSTKVSLLRFAQNFSAIQDYRNTEVQRLEAKVLKPLMKYGDLCKNMKSSIKGNQSAFEREKKQAKLMEKLQQKHPPNSPQVAQTDLNRARQETGVYGEQLISEVDVFERSKLADMKKILTEFVQIEMMFHARALEYLSKCFEATRRIDTEADVDQFRTALLEASGLARSFTQTSSSFTSTGHSATFASGTLTSDGSSFRSIYHTSPRAKGQGPMYDDADDEDSDEYDDEYES